MIESFQEKWIAWREPATNLGARRADTLRQISRCRDGCCAKHGTRGLDPAQTGAASGSLQWNDTSAPDSTMDLPTQAHLATLRDLLNYRLRELRADVHAAETARQEASMVPTHEVTDRKDEALQEQLTGVDDAQARRDREEMAEVEDALRRLDAGTYGDCVDCGEPIALPRLLVQPAARRCAACQAAHEHAAARTSVA